MVIFITLLESVQVGCVWFNDGMVSGRKSTYEKGLTEFTGSDLSSCNGKSASLVFYAQN